MPHADELRKDIDDGRTGDKVPFPDPAAAPLGTDDEAAGHAPTKAEAEQAQSAEASGATSVGSGTDERGRPYDDPGTALPGNMITIAKVCVTAVLLAIAVGIVATLVI